MMGWPQTEVWSASVVQSLQPPAMSDPLYLSLLYISQLLTPASTAPTPLWHCSLGHAGSCGLSECMWLWALAVWMLSKFQTIYKLYLCKQLQWLPAVCSDTTPGPIHL